MEDLMPRKGITPNLTSRMSDVQRNKWKEKYIKIKKRSVILSLGTITYIDVKKLIIDTLTSKLKLHGYKTTFFVLLGPYIQLGSVPFYIYGVTKKIRILAISIAEIGAKITAGEMSIMNWMWIGTDLILFGEPIPIINSTDLMIYKNQSSVINDILEVLD